MKRFRWRATIAGAGLCLAMLALTMGTARAQSIFERLVKPGDLIEGHAKLEKTCTNCHKPFSKGVQDRLCLDCHKKVSADLEGSRGFHGRSRDVSKQSCKSCHSDHLGRAADIVQFDRETFGHDTTDFKLRGAHTKVTCNGCHKANVKFRDAPSVCFDCHRRVEPHKTRLGKKCDACHSEKSWRETKPFDHAATKFALKGAHTKVACKACHIGEHYKDIPTKCVSCHRLQDAHDGRFGAKCETCHSPDKWQQVRFDHGRETKFPLIGKHAKTACVGCHKGSLRKDKLSTACVSCHRGDDAHKGQLGKRCENCHKATGWREAVAFDHDITRFPLIGLHGVVACSECHTTRSFRDAPMDCIACHRADDRHKGRLGRNCARCHNPNGWALWQFDHDSDTRFALTGAHAGLDCLACHRRKVAGRITLARTCYACHRADDAHRGSFGRRCERCHTTESFSGGFRQ